MSDLIDRQAALEAIRNCTDIFVNNLPTMIDKVDAQEALMALPSVEPEIIRCKDCKHYYYADNRIPQEQRYSCDLDGDRWKPEDFCSYAERRTDE